MNLIHGVAQCSFYCKDFAKMFHFYGDILELKPVITFRNEDGTPAQAYFKVADRQFIVITDMKYVGENKWGTSSMGHYSILVKDIYDAVSRLEAKGVLITDGPSANKCYFIAPYSTAAKPAACGSMTAWVQDPEGNEIELMQYTEASMQITCLN